MPRAARKTSETGVYHIMARGINRQDIFQDEEDRAVYLDRLSRYKAECELQIYAYCLMSNHVHLIVKEGSVSISETMKRIAVSYAYWFNYKYDRVGHLFQDRYKSEPINNDKYLLMAVRYVHQNPMKVGLDISEWTSYNDYMKSRGITDTEFVLGIFDTHAGKAKELFMKYMREKCIATFLEIDSNQRLRDSDAKVIITKIAKVANCQELQTLERTTRNAIIRELKESGISIRQLERITGINRGIILSA